MNKVGQKRRCNRSLITVTPERRALPESGQQALTAALESAVTMPRGDPTLPAPIVSGISCVGGSVCVQPRHPIAGNTRFGPRRSRRYRVFRENFCGGMEAAAGVADDVTPIRPALPVRRGARWRHQNLDTTQHRVAAWPRRERSEMRGGLGGSGWEGRVARRRRALRGMELHQRLR
jgi:hypothetical protein